MGSFSWSDLISAWLQYKAADKAGDQKPQYTISPQMEQLFNRLMGLIDYSPTRDYVSSYADSFIKSQNAPGGALNWKPTYKSEYMQGQQPLPNTGLDLSKLPIFQGDSTGKMPWNAGYTGPGIGGGAAKPPGTTLGGGATHGGGRGGAYGPRNQIGAPDGGGWSTDYYNNPYNGGSGYWTGHNNPNSPNYQGPQTPPGGIPGDDPRNEFGMIVTTMNTTSPQAAQQWNKWYSSLTPEQRQAEAQRAKRLDQWVAGLGGAIGGSIWNTIKGDPLGFGGALMTASATGGLSLLAYFGQKGIDKAAGNAWGGIVNWIKGNYGGGSTGQGTPPPTGTTNMPPGGPGGTPQP